MICINTNYNVFKAVFQLTRAGRGEGQDRENFHLNESHLMAPRHSAKRHMS